MVVVEEREEEGKETGGGEVMSLVLVCFYIPPELVWNHQQVAHARTSLAHPRPVAPHGLHRFTVTFEKPFDFDFESVVQISCNKKTTGIRYS